MVLSEIIANVLADSGADVVTYVPGYGGTAIYRALSKLKGEAPFVSFHEEVAYTVAHGAALTGMRAACLFKTHGIMKAANSVSDSLQCGTNAGLVAIITEDRGGTHSDSIIEAAPFLDGLGMPRFSAHPGNACEKLHEAFAYSEERGLPVALLLDAEEMNGEGPYERFAPPSPPAYLRNPFRHALMPQFNVFQRSIYEAKIAGKDWRSIPEPPMPEVPRDTPSNWKAVVTGYVPLFEVFRHYRGPLVTGDTGVSSHFSAAPWHCVDMVSYMGGSIPLAMGGWLAGLRPAWAVTGDFSFISAGPLGLLEASLRGIPLKILLVQNGKAATTGGQPVQEEALELALSPYRESVTRVKLGDRERLESAIASATSADRMQIVVVDCRE